MSILASAWLAALASAVLVVGAMLAQPRVPRIAVFAWMVAAVMDALLLGLELGR